MRGEVVQPEQFLVGLPLSPVNGFGLTFALQTSKTQSPSPVLFSTPRQTHYPYTEYLRISSLDLERLILHLRIDCPFSPMTPSLQKEQNNGGNAGVVN